MFSIHTLYDKVAHLFTAFFKAEAPVAKDILEKTGTDIAAAALSGKIHGSDDMIDVARKSLQDQLPTAKAAALAAAAAVIADHHADAACVSLPAAEAPPQPAEEAPAAPAEAPATDAPKEGA